MSVCNITKQILSNECIGDSLRTINTNFSALDTAICSAPYLVGSSNTNVTQQIDFLTRRFLEIDIPSQPTYFDKFSSTSSSVVLTSVELSDNTKIQCYEFPYSNDVLATKPIGTFEALVSETAGKPELTLFWFASGNDNTTAYSLNSSIDSFQRGLVYPNGEVKCFLQNENRLYIGGSFDTIGEVRQPKSAIINLNGGIEHPAYGKTGSLATNPLSSYFGELDKGSINCIKSFTQNNQTLVVYGGDFRSESLGKGLFIYNETTYSVFPFYFNGIIKDVLIDEGQNIYVVGQFDFYNYGYQAAQQTSTQRIYCNNIAKIKTGTQFDINSIDRSFAENVSNVFQSSIELNCLERYANNIYVGGNFEVLNSDSRTIHKNLAVISAAGRLIPEWKFITNGTIHTLLIDDTTLYVGGNFTVFASFDDYYDLNNIRSEYNKSLYLGALDLKNPATPVIIPDWKPKFDGPVHHLTTKNSSPNSFVVATGAFNQVNSQDANYIACLTKAIDIFGEYTSSFVVDWSSGLDGFCSPESKALLYELGGDSLFIGGTFRQISGIPRYYYAKISVPTTKTNPNNMPLSIDFGGQVLTANHQLAFNYDGVSSVRKTTQSGLWKTINKTTFPLLETDFDNIKKSNLCRFFIRRPGNSNQIGQFQSTDDIQQNSIYILGWSINYKK